MNLSNPFFDTDDEEQAFDLEAERQRTAEASGTVIDPLKDYERTIIERDLKPMRMFYEVVVNDPDKKPKTRKNYFTAASAWVEFMDEQGRHPACPNDKHVSGFIGYLAEERENSDPSIKQKLVHLNRMFKFWITDGSFAHTASFNPFQKAIDDNTWEQSSPEDFPNLSLAELREVVRSVKDWRDRFVIVTQLKLGLRASELCNIELSEINLGEHDALAETYPEIGTHERVRDHPHSLYVPCRKDRSGNKSKKRRILPLDDELRHVILQYLLVRPNNGEPYLLLSDQTNGQMNNTSVSRVWNRHFHPRYKFEDDAHTRSITSHYGRHFMTTWFEDRRGWSHNRVKYLRGDVYTDDQGRSDASIGSYIHIYVDDIREAYERDVAKFGVGPGSGA